MEPSRPIRVTKTSIFSKSPGRIFFWIDGDGGKQNILAHPITKHFMKLHEVLGDPWSYSATGCVEKLDDNDAILDQVAVKVMFTPEVIGENSIWKLI